MSFNKVVIIECKECAKKDTFSHRSIVTFCVDVFPLYCPKCGHKLSEEEVYS